MSASGRRWSLAGLGVVAIGAGLGCWYGSWWMAARLFNPTLPGPQPADAVPGLGLLEWAGRVQGLQVGGLLLVAFGLLAWLLALNHWLWAERRSPDERSREPGPRPQFLDPE